MNISTTLINYLTTKTKESIPKIANFLLCLPFLSVSRAIGIYKEKVNEFWYLGIAFAVLILISQLIYGKTSKEEYKKIFNDSAKEVRLYYKKTENKINIAFALFYLLILFCFFPSNIQGGLIMYFAFF